MAEPTSLQAVMAAVLDGVPESRPLSARQRQVCHHLLDCRTPALGGRQWVCDTCGVELAQYHSCRDRHCPHCQRAASQAWCERQRAAVLPVPYHHLVFTLPAVLNGWVEVHPEAIYSLLFASAWATLSAFGRDPKRLNGQMGLTAVLHTWGQTLVRHVHLHCLVPGGALGADGTWHRARSTYLFPVRALSHRFRGRFVARLREAWENGKLARVSGPAEVQRVLDALMATDWVVYSKPCLARTETVVDYLGRYSHRIALAESRLSDFDGGSVRLAYQDYRDGDRRKTMTLAATELMRRFLLHVLPKGVVRVRHYGFLANRCRAARLEAIRANLAAPPPAASPEPAAQEHWLCPVCAKGQLRPVAELAPRRLPCPAPRRRSEPITGG